jgi:hypothetical protein
MPSTNTGPSFRDRALTQRNATILTAILFALPTAYGFHVWSGAQQGDFLLLLLLAVSVPTAYDDLWPMYDDTWKGVVWTLAACAVATVEFVGLYVVGVESLSLSPFAASIGAFGLTTAGNLAWLLARQRTR